MNAPAGRLTALARSIDVDLASNRFAVFAALAGLLVGTVGSLAGSDVSVVGALGRGLAYGLGAFLAWAIAREVAPDRPNAARWAVAAYLPAMLLGTPDLAALAALLMATRLVSRSTGLAPTKLDLALLVGLGGFAATSTAGFVVALALAYAIHADRVLPEPADATLHEIAAVATAAVALATTVVTRSFLTGWEGFSLGAGLVVVAVIAAGTQLKLQEVHATADHTGEGLWLERVVHARRILLIALGAALLWAGGQAVSGLAPAGAAVVGTAAVGLGLTIPARLRPSAAETSEAA